jgi:hypothetical protein
MDDVISAAEKEPTSGKAIATVLNGIAAFVESAQDPQALKVMAREIRREAAAIEEMVSNKPVTEPTDKPAA